MPMIEVTLPEGALDDAAKAQLVERLTEAVQKREGMADEPKVKSLIWTFLDERPAAAMYVAGQPAGRPRYRVQVMVVAGSLDDERKEGLVADVTRAVLEAEGAANEPANAARGWCHIVDLPDGNWGAVGRIWRLQEIAEFAGIDRTRLEQGELATAR
jgi:phenylpyruvate tautomerase PptA (4-oxalocrotonate tautomerase family)